LEVRLPDYLDPRRIELVSKWVSKCSAALNGKVQGKAATCEWLAELWPAIHEFLTLADEAGKKRETSTLTLFADGPACKVILNDRDKGFVLWVSAASWREALMVLEADLVSGSADWRKGRSKDSNKAPKSS
jgi:hypothetical protein